MAPVNNNTTWVSPRTWTAGELITASIMNTHVRDQLTALKTPAGGYSIINEGADYTTTSTSFVDVDATDLIITFTTGGGDVLLFFTGSAIHSVLTGRIYFDIHESVSAARLGGDDGLLEVAISNTSSVVNATFCYRAVGLTAVSHAFKVQWKTSAATATLYAGAGTANHDVHPTFFGFEI